MERLGRYEILEELGRGAMGIVYKARDPELDRLVALKVMVPTEALDPRQLQERRERFQREGRAAARWAHPNVVTLHDVGEDQGRAFLVMEFIEGHSLEQLLQTRTTLPLDQVVTVGEQVAHALDYAHRNGIVHRDVKPANILLTREGVVKVTDFGIARITGSTFTQAGHAPGTPSYMSPEQVAGLKVDGRSDIFSLGAVVYEALTGEKAFPGDTISTVTYRIIHEDPIPLRRLNPAYPAALDACLKKALAKDPARRYARASDLARDLRAASEGAPHPAETPATATAPDSAPPRVRPAHPAPAARWLWIGAGGVAVLAIGVALVLWLRPPTTPPSPLPAPAPVAPTKVPDEEAARTKAAADEEVRKKAAAEETARKTAETKAAEERKRQEEAAARQRADEEAKRKAEGDRLAAERKRMEEERARLAQQQAALEAERKRAAEEGERKTAEAKAAEEWKRQDEAAARQRAEEEARRPPRAGAMQRRGRDNAEMVPIPAGTFTMGDTHGDGDSDERPTHQVTLDAFWIDRTEVTNAQFSRFTQAGNTAEGDWQRFASGKDQHPVVNVTWNDAAAYCRWAGKRLPTEAEWEYAARGTDGRKYPWGNTWDGSRARFSGKRGSETTAPVGSYTTGASPFGVLDLAGNVWEWVQDWYGPYPSGSTRNPTGPSTGERRVLRGASWNLESWNLHSANRDGDRPAARTSASGSVAPSSSRAAPDERCQGWECLPFTDGRPGQ